MSWGRIDDYVDDDPRWWGVGLATRGLWVSCLPWCLRANSPVVTEALVAREAGAEGPGLAQELVAAGLWVEAPGGAWEYARGGLLGWDGIAVPAELRAAKLAQKSAAGRASAEARSLKYGSAVPLNARNAPNVWPNDSISGTERRVRT